MAIFLCDKIFKEGDSNTTFVTPFVGFALINLVQYPILVMAITRSYDDSGCKKCMIISFSILIAFIYLDMGMMFLMELNIWSS